MPADSFESPLTLAACGGHVELAELLISRGANIEEVLALMNQIDYVQCYMIVLNGKTCCIG